MWGKRITFIGVLLGAAGVLAALVIRLVAVSG
jgi:hypothetical protein